MLDMLDNLRWTELMGSTGCGDAGIYMPSEVLLGDTQIAMS